MLAMYTYSLSGAWPGLELDSEQMIRKRVLLIPLLQGTHSKHINHRLITGHVLRLFALASSAVAPDRLKFTYPIEVNKLMYGYASPRAISWAPSHSFHTVCVLTILHTPASLIRSWAD